MYIYIHTHARARVHACRENTKSRLDTTRKVRKHYEGSHHDVIRMVVVVLVVVVVMVLYGRHSVNNCTRWWRRWGIVVLLAEGREGAHDLGWSEYSYLMLIYATAPATTVNDNRRWTLLERLLPFTRIIAMRKRRGGRRRRRRRQRRGRSCCCARLQGRRLKIFGNIGREGRARRGFLHPTHLLMLITAG